MNERDDHGCLVDATVRLLRDADAPERVHADAREWFEALDVPPDHTEALVATGAKRLLLYRKLVRNGIRTTLRHLIPCTAARLESSFDVWVERYCQQEMPRSHYLRDVATEFVEWVLPQWANDPTVPRHLSDLARFELFEFHIATAMKEERHVSAREVLLDKPVVFDASVRIAHFDHAVQRLAEDEADREVPTEERTVLLGYRDEAYEVQVLALNALAAGILERLWAGETLGQAVTQAFGDVPPPPVLETIAQLLADLADKKILLGAG